MATRILEANFQRVGQFRTFHDAILMPGQTVDDALKPEFWANVARQVKQFDRIALLPEDGGFYAELIVLGSGTGWAKVKLLFEIELGDECAEEEQEASTVFVKWRGPGAKFSAIRKSDNTVLKDGFADKADAEAFARNYQRTIAA